MPDKRLIWIAGALLAAMALFLIWGLQGKVWFILELRATKLAALVCVGLAIGTATVLFQTLSNNRILTPSIMGFDALFILLQTGLVFALGGFGYAQLSPLSSFALETIVMMGAAVFLFAAILHRTRQDVQLMILVGVVMGLMFRSITAFVQRLMDPSEFTMVQGAMFARFGAVDRGALVASVVLLAGIGLWLWRHHAILDVMALGRAQARGLGLAYDRLQFQMLCAIAALVSVSTALVGPLTFLGLLVASLAHSLMQSHRHQLLLPAAALIAALILVTGQIVFERILQLQSTLAVVIEFSGGLLFLILLARGRIR
ncbi:iron chelate uptake ABC transporter family permease subunit [uncultured Roseobacter sp.]|uniref:iron chelate uptake ABC transporter family permease subunit n=1 Tax=uncultured Roseobacter sp. TaxID=114847 RepID=UPI002634F08C|nr:iron chelate uptake ABC transporter family permease subunit [uncultured Roseobacter sp.]